MVTTDLLTWLIAGHLAGDFLLQTGWMAKYKSEKLTALLLHSFVYTAAVYVAALPVKELRWDIALLIFVTHALIDRRSFVRWWCRHITQSDGVPWLVVVADQAWHIVVLALACLFQRG